MQSTPPLLGLAAALAVAVALSGQMPAQTTAPAAALTILDDQPKLVILTGGHQMAGKGESKLADYLKRYYSEQKKECPLRIEVTTEEERGGGVTGKFASEEERTRKAVDSWIERLKPRLAKARASKLPVVVLAQFPLGFFFSKDHFIRNEKDVAAIKLGADGLEHYARQALSSGADLVVLAPYQNVLGHGPTNPDNPKIAHEWRAFAELGRRQLPNILAGPDLHNDTRHLAQKDPATKYPNGPVHATVHHAWLGWLCKRDGVETPAWSKQDVERALKKAGLK